MCDEGADKGVVLSLIGYKQHALLVQILVLLG